MVWLFDYVYNIIHTAGHMWLSHTTSLYSYDCVSTHSCDSELLYNIACTLWSQNAIVGEVAIYTNLEMTGVVYRVSVLLSRVVSTMHEKHYWINSPFCLTTHPLSVWPCTQAFNAEAWVQGYSQGWVRLQVLYRSRPESSICACTAYKHSGKILSYGWLYVSVKCSLKIWTLQHSATSPESKWGHELLPPSPVHTLKLWCGVLHMPVPHQLHAHAVDSIHSLLMTVL